MHEYFYKHRQSRRQIDALARNIVFQKFEDIYYCFVYFFNVKQYVTKYMLII